MNPFKIWIKVGIFQLTFTHIHTFNLGKNSAFILLNFKFHQRAVHKLRNADGVALLSQTLVSEVINRMTAKELLQVGGWSKNSKKWVT